MNETSAEMPRYRCHKEVHALQVKRVIQTTWNKELGRWNWAIEVADEGFEQVEVNAGFIYKHDPQPGDYYVVYDDGRTSVLSAKAFNEGYDKL